MSAFKFSTLTQSPDEMQVQSACLGVSSGTKLTDQDIGKIVKLAASDNFVLAATTNEIEGILFSVSPETYNDGFAFGSVQRRGRIEAIVGTNEAGTVDPGDLVVADTQAAIDTAGSPQVMVGTPSEFMWRCISILSGTGVTGDTVLIERV